MGVRRIIDATRPWFVRKVDEYLMQGSTNFPTVGRFRPSGVSECARENLYCYIGVVTYPPFEISSVRYMMRGTYNQGTWEDLFKRSGVTVKTACRTCYKADRAECVHDYPVAWSMESPLLRGSPDFILGYEGDTFYSPGDYLTEWKSSMDPSKPHWGYYLQWQLYSHMTGLHRGFLVKQNPSSFVLTPHFMRYNAKFMGEMLTWLRFIEGCARTKEMIPRDDKCGSDRPWGTGCQIYDFCHSSDGDSPWKLISEETLKVMLQGA